jgi:hypothetical protein
MATRTERLRVLNQAMTFYEEAIAEWRAHPPATEEERRLRQGERMACWEIIGGMVSTDGRAR